MRSLRRVIPEYRKRPPITGGLFVPERETMNSPSALSDCVSSLCRNKATHGKLYCHECSTRINVTLGQLGAFAPGQTGPVQPVFHADKLKVNDVEVQPMKNEYHDRRSTDDRMSYKYPKYYKSIPTGMVDLDIYAVCQIFQVNDYSGAIHHAIKKLLLPGVRTGGKTRRDDIKEARDTLTRWLELNS